jgi:DNA repair exonuclease SbcCD nuclease subunit
MTIYAFVADVHVGNHQRFGGASALNMNERCRRTLDVLDVAYDIAANEGAKAFVVAGDLFDTDKPNTRMVAAVQEIFCIDDKLEVFLITGNHDQYSYTEGDHALGPLYDHATVIERPKAVVINATTQLIMIPYRTGRASDWLPKAFNSVAFSPQASKRILCLHLGIKDEKTAPWLRDAEDSVTVKQIQELMRRWGISIAFAGHWHDHRAWGPQQPVVQIGALCPTGWNNPGTAGYGRVAFYDDESRKLWFKEIPGPRFLKAVVDETDDWRHVLRTAEAINNKKGGRPYVQLTVPSQRVAEFIELKKNTAYALDVVPDKTEAQVAARTAAQAAKSSDNMKQSVVSYVNEIAIDEGINRANVQRRLERYLGV